MNLADLLIVIVAGGICDLCFREGFFCRGLFAGRCHSWALHRRGKLRRIRTLGSARGATTARSANLIAFLLIALLVMLLAGLAGRLLRGLFRGVGLGIVDRLLGAVFGLVEGCIVVTLVLMGIVAFLPRQDWLVAPGWLRSF
jgi:hypothetical protein